MFSKITATCNECSVRTITELIFHEPFWKYGKVRSKHRLASIRTASATVQCAVISHTLVSKDKAHLSVETEKRIEIQ